MQKIAMIVSNPKALPTLIITISIAAGAVCLLNKDWRRALYWWGGALINIVVTY